MKKITALILCAVMLLGLFAGCNKKDTAESTTASTINDIYEDATPAGTLYVSFGAAIEVIYDDEGNVLKITGTNEVGKTIAAACNEQLGKGCVFAVRKMLRYASDNNLLGDAKSMVVRVGAGDPLPADDFLDTIATDTQYLADEECTGIQMMRLEEDDDLDSAGNLIPEAARLLAARYLGVAEEALSGEETIVDGLFTFSCGEKSCTVDAFTGLVSAK